MRGSEDILDKNFNLDSSIHSIKATMAGGAIPPDSNNNNWSVEDRNQTIQKRAGNTKYADLLKSKGVDSINIRVPPKPIIMLHGEPTIT